MTRLSPIFRLTLPALALAATLAMTSAQAAETKATTDKKATATKTATKEATKAAADKKIVDKKTVSKKDSAAKDTAQKTTDKKTAATAAAPAKAAAPVAAKPDAPADTSSPAAASGNDDETLTVADADETYTLPAYPPNARIASGSMTTYTVKEEDTFLDIARHYGLGYIELRAANPGVDPWAPTPGEQLVIPTFNLLPRAPQNGIVVNLGDMRMYYFKTPGKPPLTYALGIGAEGLDTPLGQTTVVRKAAYPSWYPTERMKKLKPYLPAAVAPGPSNPLGTHAMYLGWPTFLIHGSNKPWGIGRRVSSGCMRMYPENVIELFDQVPVGTKVTIVDQPILVGWLEDGLYLEANPSKTQGEEIEITGVHTVRPLTDELKKVIADAAGPEAESRIDWDAVDSAVRERRGYPVLIAQREAPRKVSLPKEDAGEEVAKADKKTKPAEAEKTEATVVPKKYN